MQHIRNCEAGSVWRKWDLHLHTPSSFDYINKSISNEEIISVLKKNHIAGGVVTDHHFIDVDRISNLQSLAGDDITIFPGIELRSQLGGKHSVHYTGIFPETINLNHVWRSLSVTLKLTAEDINGKSPESLYVPFEDGANAIHNLGGLVAVHAGGKANTIENIVNATEFQQAIKTDLLVEYVDIIEVGKLSDVDEYRKIVFKNIGVELPIVTCSDNHDIRSFTMRNLCWIKADVTFLGLKQTIIEPFERIFVGDYPPASSTVDANPTRFIDSVEIKKKDGSSLSEKWFSHSIPLNQRKWKKCPSRYNWIVRRLHNGK
jgi:hypothetical protein